MKKFSDAIKNVNTVITVIIKYGSFIFVLIEILGFASKKLTEFSDSNTKAEDNG